MSCCNVKILQLAGNGQVPVDFGNLTQTQINDLCNTINNNCNIVANDIDFNSLTAQDITELTQTIDFTQLTAQQQIVLLQAMDFNQLTAQQITDITQSIDIAQFTPQQATELCQLISNTCDIGEGLNLNGNVVELLDGQGDVIDTIDLTPILAGTTTNTLTYNGGVLTSTVNGVPATATLSGQEVRDSFGNLLGYYLAV